MRIKRMLSCLIICILLFVGTYIQPVSAEIYHEYAYWKWNGIGGGEIVTTEDGLILDVDSSLCIAYVIGHSGEETTVHIPDKYGNSYVYGVFLIDTNIEKAVFPKNTAHITDFIFAGSKKLDYVELPENCLGIGGYSFYGCESLKEIKIPEKVINIDRYAFANSGLETISLPKETGIFGKGVFEGCRNLKTVEINSSNIQYSIYDEMEPIFRGFYVADNLFKDCTSLKSVNIPESTKSIGEGAFQNSGLTSITIPKNVKIVYKKAFYGCKNLASVKFSGKVNNIGRSAFSKCVNLKTVNFTKGYLKKVYDYAFYKCEKLDKITISNTKNVPTIAKSAFNKAKSGIKFYVKNNTVAKKLKAKLQKTNIKKAKIYRSAPILIYKNVG